MTFDISEKETKCFSIEGPLHALHVTRYTRKGVGITTVKQEKGNCAGSQYELNKETSMQSKALENAGNHVTIYCKIRIWSVEKVARVFWTNHEVTATREPMKTQ